MYRSWFLKNILKHHSLLKISTVVLSQKTSNALPKQLNKETRKRYHAVKSRYDIANGSMTHNTLRLEVLVLQIAFFLPGLVFSWRDDSQDRTRREGTIPHYHCHLILNIRAFNLHFASEMFGFYLIYSVEYIHLFSGN